MRSNIRPGLLLQALGMIGVLPPLPLRRSEEVDLAASEQAMRELAEAGIDPAAVLEIAGRPSRFVETARGILAMHKTLLAQGQRITDARELHERWQALQEFNADPRAAIKRARFGTPVEMTIHDSILVVTPDARDVSRAGRAAELASQARAAVKSASWGAPRPMAIHDEITVTPKPVRKRDRKAQRAHGVKRSKTKARRGWA